MLSILRALVSGLFHGRAALIAENLALRHQLTVLHRSVKRPSLGKRDRTFRVWLSRMWPGRRSALLIVKPETVVKWHRQGFQLFWRWKSQGKPGRPRIDPEIQNLIRRMSRENATCGVPRIQSDPTATWTLPLNRTLVDCITGTTDKRPDHQIRPCTGIPLPLLCSPGEIRHAA